jgi:hypothetical protein
MHILYADWGDYAEFFAEIIEILQTRIQTPADYHHFFPNLIKIRCRNIAIKGLELIQTINTNPEAKKPFLQKILADLGLPNGGNDPDIFTLFNPVQKWAHSIPLADKELNEKIVWLKTQLLKPTPAEITKHKAKEDREQEKLNKVLEKETAKKEKDIKRESSFTVGPTNQ